MIDIKATEVESADAVARAIERAEKLLGAGRVRYIHPDCGFWMLKRPIADAKIRALAQGRDLLRGAHALSRATATSELSDRRTELPPTSMPAAARSGADAGAGRMVVRRATGNCPMAKLKIYLVEDSSVIRENLVDALHESAPIEIVGCADDERGAVAWLRAGNDMRPGDRRHLPEGRLRPRRAEGARRDAAAPPRIVLSNHATPEIRKKCQELGATKVFDKSNELDEMLAWLSRFARSGRGAAASHS